MGAVTSTTPGSVQKFYLSRITGKVCAVWTLPEVASVGTLTLYDTAEEAEARGGGDPVFHVGQPVLTNRYYGATAFADRATVIEVRSMDYVIRYDEPGRDENDFPVVGRTAHNLRAV